MERRHMSRCNFRIWLATVPCEIVALVAKRMSVWLDSKSIRVLKIYKGVKDEQ